MLLQIPPLARALGRRHRARRVPLLPYQQLLLTALAQGWGGMGWGGVGGTDISEIYGFALSILMKERNSFFFCLEEAAVGAESQQLYSWALVFSKGERAGTKPCVRQ